LAVAQGPGIVGNAAIVSNVGDVETMGLELLGSWQIGEHVSLFGSYSYNDSTYQDDVRNRAGTVLALTGGKRVVNTAEHLAFGELAYDDDALFASISANYIGDRFFTFTNTGGKVDGRVLADLTLGYRFSGSPLLEGLEVRANVSNLFDEEYVGTLGTNGFVNAGDSQTLVTGAPRQLFLTVRKVF
jgi:iron complex outermembrane recepter protein